MNIAINGSLSHISDNINHMLSKAKITRHMVKSYNINNLLDIVNINVNIPSENSLRVGAFVRTVVVDRDYATLGGCRGGTASRITRKENSLSHFHVKIKTFHVSRRKTRAKSIMTCIKC